MARRGIRRTLTVLAATGAVMLPFAARPGAASAAPPGGNDAHRYVTVMTRNMDEGTDFGYLTKATTAQQLGAAILATYVEVVSSDVCGRAARIADEIASAQPDLVSLQEVARWTGFLPSTCAGGSTTIDAQKALMAELAAKGARYTVVRELDEFSSAGIQGLGPLSFLDRDLLLARAEPPGQLSLSNATAAHFTTILPLPLPGGLVANILRGWISVDATLRGRTVRVIATHLESFFQPVQEGQALELLAGPAHTSLPVIIAGDLNTGPGSAQQVSYGLLTVVGHFTDTWGATRPGDNGYTDAFYTEDPFTLTAGPTERIDLVLVRGELVPTRDIQVGTTASHPSDHAGVVATVRIPS
jgi:endonuclease/exonuclease/phosphatase family metal-dependent hydrolase